MTPDIIAHRGGALLWPENSLAACRGAIALGVQQIQLDVRLSADGEALVMHDATLDRTTEATGPVDTRSWADLAAIPLRDAAGETIPSLAAAADLLSTSATRLRLELKQPPSRPELPERALLALLRAGMLERAVVTSFDLAHLQRVRALAPTVALAWMLDAPATASWSEADIDSAASLDCATIGIRWDRLTPALRRSLEEAGLRLCCFGANDAAALDACAGADEISTDRPDLALRRRR